MFRTNWRGVGGFRGLVVASEQVPEMTPGSTLVQAYWVV